MGIKKLVLLSFLSVVFCLPAFAQRDSISLNTIIEKSGRLSTEHPFEKVYLHFDKPYYAVGDTLWFKAYLTIGAQHQLSTFSNIIYVDIISNKDTLVKALKVSAINGVGFGNVTLNSKLFNQGNYHIRAYTNWMRNFGPEYFFNKTVTIGDAEDIKIAPKISFTKVKRGNGSVISAKMIYKDQSGNPVIDKKVNWTIQSDDETVLKGKGTTDKNGLITISIPDDQLKATDEPDLVTTVDLGKKQISDKFSLKSALAVPDVQFFPEGGELISGVRSKIAFKAVNPYGLGVQVSGSVVDNAGNEVAGFEAQHAGMGIFALLPELGKTYKAIVTFPNGTKSTFDLPNVYGEGINLAVNNNDPDNLSVKVATNAEFFKKYQNKGIYIVAQSGGVIYYTGLASLQSLVYTAQVPKSKFPTGILQVTLLAANGEPLSERIVFIQHNDALNLLLTTNLPSYGIKQNVKMTFTAKNKALPVNGTFSLAVIDETKVPFDQDAESTIMSNLLLTSDLKGYIEKPAYYFNTITEQTAADLDVLMLTQGYRRFLYTDLLADKYPSSKFLPEQGMVVSGTLRTSAGLPVFRGAITLKVPDRNVSVSGATDADGRFSFSNVSVFDSSKVILSARNNANSGDMMIMADVPTYQKITKNPFDPDAPSNIDSVLNTYLQLSKKRLESLHMLKEVVIKSARVVGNEHPFYTALVGLSLETDQTVTAERLKNCGVDLVDCMISAVFGLFRVDNDLYIKKDYLAGNKKPIQFYVNGSVVDMHYIMNMRTDEVKSIDVYLKDGVSGINNIYNSNGIISITTKSGGYAANPQSTDLSALALVTQTSEVTLMPKGYSRAKAFYSPKYVNVQVAKDNVDYRSTIFWEPNIITDKTGTTTFDYYTSGTPGTYRAVIEGIDADGNLGRYVMRYKVK